MKSVLDAPPPIFQELISIETYNNNNRHDGCNASGHDVFKCNLLGTNVVMLIFLYVLLILPL